MQLSVQITVERVIGINTDFHPAHQLLHLSIERSTNQTPTLLPRGKHTQSVDL